MATQQFDAKSVRLLLNHQTVPSAFIYDKQGPVYHVNFSGVEGSLELVMTYDPEKHVLTGSGEITASLPGHSLMKLETLYRSFRDTPPVTEEQLAASRSS